MAKELLHGLRLLSFCSSGLFCKPPRQRDEGGNCLQLRISTEHAKFDKASPPNTVGNVRTDRLRILKSQIIVVFSIQTEIQNSYPRHCCFLRIFKSAEL